MSEVQTHSGVSDEWLEAADGEACGRLQQTLNIPLGKP